MQRLLLPPLPPFKTSQHRPLTTRQSAFTLLELLLAFGLSILCIGLGLSYIYTHTDLFSKEETKQNLYNLGYSALSQVSNDLQGIDFSLEANQALLDLAANDWLGQPFLTRLPQDHPLFADTFKTVRYLLLEQTDDRVAGLYREESGQQALILPHCKGLHITLYGRDTTQKTLKARETRGLDPTAQPDQAIHIAHVGRIDQIDQTSPTAHITQTAQIQPTYHTVQPSQTTQADHIGHTAYTIQTGHIGPIAQAGQTSQAGHIERTACTYPTLPTGQAKARDWDLLAYAQIHLRIEWPCLKTTEAYSFQAYIDYPYALFL